MFVFRCGMLTLIAMSVVLHVLRSWAHCGLQLTAADMRVVMRLADADKDGRISLKARFPTCATSLTYDWFRNGVDLPAGQSVCLAYVNFTWVKTA